MKSRLLQKVLICPYTLIEEEALAWSLILFDQVTFLHPFPLRLPVPYEGLIAQGLVQIFSPQRTREEIREKDKRLREIQAFLAGNPDRSFLELLKKARPAGPFESRDEIISLLRGRPPVGGGKPENRLEGDILLSLIHDWMLQEWEIVQSLKKIEAGEKSLSEGWKEGFEEAVHWGTIEPGFVESRQIEVVCPPALKAWWKLKTELGPEFSFLLSTQRWVGSEVSGSDFEDKQVLKISLPEIGSFPFESFEDRLKSWQEKEVLRPIRETLNHLIETSALSEREGLAHDLQTVLTGLGLPASGRACLILPPSRPSPEESLPLILFALKG